MPDPTITSDADALTDLRWVRALARSLIRDPHRADDLAQDACLAAVQGPQPPSRAFTAGVIRNLWRQALRTGRRRLARETRAAREEGVPATDELVARAEAQRTLMAEVLALDEPYRSTLLLRFFEGLAPREIARRTATKVATVQSRLTRALQILRARLDVAHGRQRWLSALAPLLPAAWWPVATTTAISMKTKTLVVAASVAVAVSFGVYATSGRADAVEAGLAPASSTLTSVGGTGNEGAGLGSDAHAPGAATRSPIASPAAPVPGPGDSAFRAHGTVFLADGTPGPGIALALRDAPGVEVARSGAGGVFEVEAHVSPVALVAADPRYVTLREGVYQREAPQRAVVVVAPGYAIGGRVVDEHQRPLPGAHLRLSLPADWAARFAEDLEASQGVGFTARAEALGRFAFPSVPNVAGSKLRVVLDGYASTELPAPDLARDDLEVVLAGPAVTATGALRGRVLTHDGEGAAGARVALGLTSALADDRGFFDLDLRRAVTSEQLRAVTKGFQPAMLDRPAGGTWPDYVELRLGPPSLCIRGVVVDAAGTPVEGARVWPADVTTFGMLGMMPMEVEGLAAGATIPPQALEAAANLPAEDGDGDWNHTMSRAKPLACWNYATTDSGGHFELLGLAARTYRLEVLVDTTLQLATSAPIPAGTADARIALGRPEVWEEFGGRVACGGAPVANVEVSLRRTARDIQARAFGGRVVLRFDFPGARTRTDAEGRFTLRDVPRHGCFLMLKGDAILPANHLLDPTARGQGTEIEVDGRCQLRVEIAPPLDRADAIALVDGRGEPLDLLVLSFGSTSATTDLPLHAGKSAAFSCSTKARRIVLLREGEPVGSIELPPLRAGDSHTVGR